MLSVTRPPRRPRFFRPARAPGGSAGRANGLSNHSGHTLEIERLSSEGRGIGFLPGEGGASPTPVFVAGALPGERVTVRVTRRTSQIAEAELLAVERTSMTRQLPACPLFARCGGCQLQMLSVDAQLAHKQQVLQQLLEPLGVSAWLAPLTAAPWRYRHRARFAVRAGPSGLPVIGYRAAASHQVVPVEACAVIDERLERLLPLLPGWLAELEHWQRIDELLLAVDATGRLAMSWRAAPKLSPRDGARLTELAGAAGVSIDPVDLLYPVVRSAGGVDGRVGGRTASRADHEVGLGCQFRLADFTQVNPAVNQLLVEQVCRWLEPVVGDLIADYFCGLGNFALALAAPGISVVGFESVPEMVVRAGDNAARLGLSTQVSFAATDLFCDARIPAGLTKALLDPPRAGARALCERLAQSNLERIVYVSCNPQTLVRDLRILGQGGYSIRQAALADMFPHTGHSEAVVMLSR